MQKTLLLILFSALALLSANAQVVLEDFEGGADLNWNAADGTYDGVVENPATDGLNPSTDVGSYTKSDMTGFSLFITELDAPLDLSNNNQFSIQIYAGAPTQILLKLEGDGEAIELTKNIATENVWRTYNLRREATILYVGEVLPDGSDIVQDNPNIEGERYNQKAFVPNDFPG